MDTKRRLQVGMWEQFSLEKWDRWKADSISGMEICSFASEDDLQSFKEWSVRNKISFGIHTPVLNTSGYKLPRLTSILPMERQGAWKLAEEEVITASRYNADYILFHFPFPALLPSINNTRFARLTSKNERYDPQQCSKSEFKEISLEVFEKLCELQEKHRQRIVLEHDFFGDYADVVIERFMQFPELKLVLDTARLDIGYRAFGNYDPYKLLDSLAPYVYLVHYSNVRYEDDGFHNHMPDLPEYEEDRRYGDSFAYLKYLAARNHSFHVTFEHKADLVTRNQLLEIYNRLLHLFG